MSHTTNIQLPSTSQDVSQQAVTSAPTDAVGKYDPKSFDIHYYETLRLLCDMIIPADDGSGGALAARVPEFIDLLARENYLFQMRIGGGMVWLDAICTIRYGNCFIDSRPSQQREILDGIAYRENAERDSALVHGLRFFSELRKWVVDGFFTSELGVRDLRYMGNIYVDVFSGCPNVPDL